MPPPRRAQRKKKQALRGPLPSIAEDFASASQEESGAATLDEFPAVTGREERLARRLARQKDFNSNPGSSATVIEFQRALSSTKARLAQFETDLAKLHRLSESGRATGPAPTPAVQETPPAPRSPAPDTPAAPFPLIPIPAPPQRVVQQSSGGWIPYYSGPPAGVSLHYIDGAGRPVAQVIPHLYFPWPATPPGEHDAEDESGDGHYYYAYFALPPQGW